MAASVRLQTLEIRLGNLRSTFLPSEFDPTGTYDQDIYDRTTAFRIMAHAEFESFLEDIITETVEAAINQWNLSKAASVPLLCILSSFEEVDRINAFKGYAANKRPPTLTTLVHKAFTHFKHNVGNNNGIRTENLLALLIQAGIEESDLEATWVGAVDAFGVHRNIVGHKSGVVAYRADPKMAAEAVETVLIGFREIDNRLLGLRESIIGGR